MPPGPEGLGGKVPVFHWHLCHQTPLGSGGKSQNQKQNELMRKGKLNGPVSQYGQLHYAKNLLYKQISELNAKSEDALTELSLLRLTRFLLTFLCIHINPHNLNVFAEKPNVSSNPLLIKLIRHKKYFHLLAPLKPLSGVTPVLKIKDLDKHQLTDLINSVKDQKTKKKD